jgi:hypothetical protein
MYIGKVCVGGNLVKLGKTGHITILWKIRGDVHFGNVDIRKHSKIGINIW